DEQDSVALASEAKDTVVAARTAPRDARRSEVVAGDFQCVAGGQRVVADGVAAVALGEAAGGRAAAADARVAAEAARKDVVARIAEDQVVSRGGETRQQIG